MLKEIAVVMLVSALVSGVVAGCASSSAQGTRTGDLAPNFQLPNLEGKLFPSVTYEVSR